MQKKLLIKIHQPMSGFFGCLKPVLIWMHYADRVGLDTYVEYSSASAYFEYPGFKGTDNPYEYYFYQKQKMDEDIYITANMDMHHQEEVVLGTSIGYSYKPYNDNFYRELGKTYKKHMVLQPEIECCIREGIGKLLEPKTLGVHIRGTDYKKNFKNHPKQIGVDDYIRVIQEMVADHEVSKIFLATDDEDIAREFRRKVNLPILCYDLKRSSGDMSLAFCADIRENHRYQLGVEVLRDVYTLASCDYFIGCPSLVDVFVKIIAESKGHTFAYEKIIDHGIWEESSYFYVPNKRLGAKERERLLLDAWMMQLERGKKLSDYLDSAGYKSCAIYGCGRLGKHIYRQLKENGIDVQFYIEKNGTGHENGIPIFSISDLSGFKEIVINSVLYDDEAIRRQLLEKEVINIVGIEDIVYAIM